eukprot:6212134-Pleurochrysis_carterae.AAC.2
MQRLAIREVLGRHQSPVDMQNLKASIVLGRKHKPCVSCLLVAFSRHGFGWARPSPVRYKICWYAVICVHCYIGAVGLRGLFDCFPTF